MSSNLRDLVHRDLEQIPLPPASAWTVRRPHQPQRRVNLVASVALVTVVVVASLTGGQLLRAARDRIEALRASSLNTLIAGNDLLYVADGDAATQGLQIVAMPSGQLVGRFDAASYLGTPQEGDLTSITGDLAFLPVARRTAGADQYDTYLQEIDLRRGVALQQVRTGTFTLPQPTGLPDAARFPAATATSSDGRSLWFVRDTGERGQVAQVYRFDVHGLAAGPAAQAALTTSGNATVRSRLIPLGTDKVIVMRDQYASLIRIAADWYVLDAQTQRHQGLRG